MIHMREPLRGLRLNKRFLNLPKRHIALRVQFLILFGDLRRSLRNLRIVFAVIQPRQVHRTFHHVAVAHRRAGRHQHVTCRNREVR